MLCTEISYLAYYITSRNFHMPSEKLSSSENLSVFHILDMNRIKFSSLFLFKTIKWILKWCQLGMSQNHFSTQDAHKGTTQERDHPSCKQATLDLVLLWNVEFIQVPCSDSISLIVLLIVIQLLKSMWGQKRASSDKHTTDCIWFSLPLSSANIIIPILQKSKLRSREFKSLAQEHTAN